MMMPRSARPAAVSADGDIGGYATPVLESIEISRYKYSRISGSDEVDENEEESESQSVSACESGEHQNQGENLREHQGSGDREDREENREDPEAAAGAAHRENSRAHSRTRSNRRYLNYRTFSENEQRERVYGDRVFSWDDPANHWPYRNPRRFSTIWRERREDRDFALMWLMVFFGFLIWAVIAGGEYSHSDKYTSCDCIDNGYECSPEISHHWGQYSPYFTVPSEITTEVPSQCNITFAQLLSRHGARDPTASKTKAYNATIQQIKQAVSKFSGNYTFLSSYEYTLGADQLTSFGEQQMVNSGIKFYERYEKLTKDYAPFVRSSGENRVIESAKKWTRGFHSARSADKSSHNNSSFPIVNVVISEDEGANNTLSHDLCTAFEDGFDSTIGSSAQAIFASIFTPPITSRLNDNLPGANLSMAQTIYMMDLCPFNTVASPLGKISPFCKLFTEKEWKQYDYYQTLGKFYGYSWGNPLGATQGVGFSNELIARLTHTPVVDHTSTNSTLDSNPTTFPLDEETKLYADFSHDNDMTAIFSALGLYNETSSYTHMISNTTIEHPEHTHGYSASWTVPFGARAYIEKMSCVGSDEELVRVLVNDRVVPLVWCGGNEDQYGRCGLEAFVDGLGFAREGGNWDQCFV